MGLNEELLEESEKDYDSDEEEDDDPTYGSVYGKFLEQYHQPKLDEEIEAYLSSNVQMQEEKVKDDDDESERSFRQPGRERNKTYESIEMA